MRAAILDRLLWIPDEWGLEKRIKSDLTLLRSSFDDGLQEVILFEHDHKTDMMGVPRRFGLKSYVEYLKTYGIVDKTVYPHINWPKHVWPIVNGKKWDYLPGQLGAIETVVAEFIEKGEYGTLLDAPCGSGKTFMALKVSELLQTPTLIFVHKNDLAVQWWRTAATGYRDKDGNWISPMWPGLIHGHVQQDMLKFRGCHIVTSMVQTLNSRINELPPDFWTYFGHVVTDEGHLYPAATFEAMLRMPHARYRTGISATWQRKDGMECIWHYHIGAISARPRVVRLGGEYVQIPWPTQLTDKEFKSGSMVSAPKWISAIAENVKYNCWLVDRMVDCAESGRKAVIVTDRRDHCMELRKRYMDKMVSLRRVPDVGLYIGNTSDYSMTNEEKDRAKRKKMIIATYGMMALGTDIPDLDTIFLATPRSDITQAVGRIQRPVEKKPLIIVDPVFQTPFNVKMATKRREQYEKLGFKPKMN